MREESPIGIAEMQTPTAYALFARPVGWLAEDAAKDAIIERL
ncbi:hypothetical protein [Haematomicrobium sanguinis]|nr:hypothetical protein [Haematomicrobium sanguinis]